MHHHPARLTLDQPASYRILVQGQLDARWVDCFPGMHMTVSCVHTLTVTTLMGSVPDQAALHGLLRTLYGLGLPLLEIEWLDAQLAEKSELYQS